MTELLTDALATFRLTRAITTDRVGQPIRDAVALYRNETANYYVQCDWCVSLAVAFGVVTARMVAPRVWQPIAQALAFSAATGMLAERL